MSNQPPARPWFRLPTMARQPAPAPQAQPQPPQPPVPQQPPRLPVIRPAFRPAFAQPRSASQPPPPPLSSPPTPTEPPNPPSPPPPMPITSPSPPPSRQPTAPSPPPIIASPPSPVPTMTSVISPTTYSSLPTPISSRKEVEPQSPIKSTHSPPPPPMPITSPSPSLSRQPTAPSPPPIVASPPSPVPAMTTVISPTTYSPLPTPISSRKEVEPQSPIKSTRSPPPISLSPSQLNSSKADPDPRSLPEVEQEKALLQETFNKKVVFPTSQGNPFKGFGRNAYDKSHKHGRHKEAEGGKPSSDSDDGKNVRIITMTGDNKGACMELGFPSRNDKGGGAMHSHRGKPLGNSYESDSSVGNDDQSSKKKDHKGKGAQSRLPMSGYVNSNVQGINNSILFNCSFTHNDPGVHFSLSRKPVVHGKAESNGVGIHHPNGKPL